MNYNLLEYYESTFELLNAFKKDRYLHTYMMQILFGRNSKITFDNDGSYTISVSNDDYYAGIQISNKDIVLNCIKSDENDPMSLYVSKVSLISRKLSYSQEFLSRAGIQYKTSAQIIDQSGSKKLKTIVYNSLKNRKHTTCVSVGNSYISNKMSNEFALLKEKSSVAKNVINALIESQKSLELSCSEVEHKLEAVERIKSFKKNDFVYKRAFDIVLLANNDKSNEDNLSLSYNIDNTIIDVEITSNKESIHCEHTGSCKKSTFSCVDGKFIGETLSETGDKEVGEIVYQDNKKFLVIHDHKNVKSKIEHLDKEEDDLHLMSTYSYVGRNALYDINSSLYSMTKDEPYIF